MRKIEFVCVALIALLAQLVLRHVEGFMGALVGSALLACALGVTYLAGYFRKPL